jgi:hypothetical protein
MEGGVVVEGLVVLLLLGGGVGPVDGAFGQADEVGDRLGRLLLVELAGDAAHGGIHDDGRAVGMDHGRGGGLGRVGQGSAGGGVDCCAVAEAARKAVRAEMRSAWESFMPCLRVNHAAGGLPEAGAQDVWYRHDVSPDSTCSPAHGIGRVRALLPWNLSRADGAQAGKEPDGAIRPRRAARPAATRQRPTRRRPTRLRCLRCRPMRTCSSRLNLTARRCITR